MISITSRGAMKLLNRVTACALAGLIVLSSPVSVSAKQKVKEIPAEASKAAKMGYSCLWSGDFRMASDYYTAAIAVLPDKGEYWFYRGVARLMGKENHTSAVEDFDKALSCKMGFGDNKMCKMARKVALGDKKGFIGDMKFLDIFLPGKYIYPIRGVGRGIMGDWAGALEDCNKVINTKDAFEGVYFGRAFSKYNLSDMIGAVENFDQAIRAWPDYIIATSYRGLSKLNLGDFSGAETDFNLALGKANDSAFAYWGRGRTRLAAGNKTGAEEDFTQAIAYDKRAADSYTQRGLIRYEAGNLDGAKSDFDKAMSIAPDNGYVLRDLAKYKSLCGDQAGAVETMKKAVAWFKEFGEPFEGHQTELALEKLGAAHPVVASGMTSPAVSAVNQALAVAPNRPIADKWALVVGISKFEDPLIHPLTYAAKDAVDFYNYLIKDAGFKPDHVHLLLDEQADARRIKHEIGDDFLIRAVGPDDLVVIYFSTHGSSPEMDSQGDSYLISYDSEFKSLWGSIEMNKLSAEIKKHLQTNRMLLILDACHSGATDSSSKGLTRGTNFNAEQIVQGCGKQVVCSSRPEEQSWLSKRYSNSVFTKQLLEALRSQGKYTKLSSAFDNMASQVESEVRRDRGEAQHPVHNTTNWIGDDIVLGADPTRPGPGVPQADLKIPKEYQ